MEYQALGGEKGLLDTFVVLSAIATCLATAGLAFGFSALVPPLLHAGAFRERCNQKGCPEQMAGAMALSLGGV